MGAPTRAEPGTQPPAVILMAGLQGAGKTTSWPNWPNCLKSAIRKKVTVVRPMSTALPPSSSWKPWRGGGCDFFPRESSTEAGGHRQAATEPCQEVSFSDVLIVDTAGRLAVDRGDDGEIAAACTLRQPDETLFVVDAMTGQDAANYRQGLWRNLPLTGVILTKVDADTRGGAALSVRSSPASRSSSWVWVRKLAPWTRSTRIAWHRAFWAWAMYVPDRRGEQKVDKKKAESWPARSRKGQRFDLEDFRDQLQQMNNMGGITGMLDKLPGMGNMAKWPSRTWM